MSIIIFQLYHLISCRLGTDILLRFTKVLLLSQLLLVLRGLAVEGQTGSPIQIIEDDIQQILNAHNFFRSIVEPPASNMQRMVSFFITNYGKKLARNLHSAVLLNCTLHGVRMA